MFPLQNGILGSIFRKTNPCNQDLDSNRYAPRSGLSARRCFFLVCFVGWVVKVPKLYSHYSTIVAVIVTYSPELNITMVRVREVPKVPYRICGFTIRTYVIWVALIFLSSEEYFRSSFGFWVLRWLRLYCLRWPDDLETIDKRTIDHLARDRVGLLRLPNRVNDQITCITW